MRARRGTDRRLNSDGPTASDEPNLATNEKYPRWVSARISCCRQRDGFGIPPIRRRRPVRAAAFALALPSTFRQGDAVGKRQLHDADSSDERPHEGAGPSTVTTTGQRPLPQRIATWVKIRRTVVCHPYTVRRELAELVTGAPWYATARPFAIIQHWAPDLFTPITMCGKWAGERSTSEIRTALGWHCRKCHRRTKRLLRARRAQQIATNPHPDETVQ